MGRTFDPKPVKAGPGSALQGGRRRSRKQQQQPKSRTGDSKHEKKKTQDDDKASKKEERFIGQDLVESMAVGAAVTAGAKKKATTKSALTSSTMTLDAAATAALVAATSSTTTMMTTTCCRRQALGLDTRVIDTLQGQKMATQLLKQLEAFVRDLDARGARPSLLVMTTNPSAESNNSNNKKKKGSMIVLQTETSDKLAEILVDNNKNKNNDDTPFLQQVPFAPAAAHGDKDKNAAVHPPKALMAKFSWKLLEGMIDSVCKEDKNDWKKKATAAAKKTKKQQQQGQPKQPLNITLLTTDASFFCDTNPASHAEAANKFWDAASRFFVEEKSSSSSSSVDSIRIVVAKMGVVGLVQPNKKKEHSNHEDSTSASLKDDDNDDMVDVENHDIGNDDDDDDAALVRSHELAVAKCMHAIRTKFAERAASQMDEMLLVDDKDGGINHHLVDISISLMDDAHGGTGGTLGYKHLARHWVRQAAAPHLSGRLEFDLPETLDGTECKLCFETNYKVFPTALNDMATFPQLAGDLRLLNSSPQSSIKALQLVPQSSLDASLLFGIPITLTTGLENDFEKYKMMDCLVRALFRSLYENDSALLLQSTASTATSSDDDEDDTSGSIPHLFHQPGEIFVLLPQELPKAAKTYPHSGLLLRYANANQFLGEATIPPPSSSFLDPDTEAELSDYVQRALDGLDMNPVNPLWMKNSSSSPNTTTTAATDELEQMDDLTIGGSGHESQKNVSAKSGTDDEGVAMNNEFKDTDDMEDVTAFE